MKTDRNPLFRLVSRALGNDLAEYRVSLARILALLSIPILLSFGISDFVRGADQEGIATLIVAAFIITILLVFDRVRHKAILYRTGLFLLILNFIMIVVIDPAYEYAFQWLYITPIPIMLLLGGREGSVWTILTMTAAIVASQFAPHRADIHEPFLVRFAVIYALISGLALIVEYVRAKTYLALQENQIELIAANEQLYQNSIRDTLTGLYNRTFLADPLEKVLAQSLRTKTQLAFIMLDINNFKEVNDTCGHVTGDEALRAISHTIATMMKRCSDFGIRYGGDEFLLILPDTSQSAAEIFATKIKEKVEKIKIPYCSVDITISFGVAELFDGLDDLNLPPGNLVTALISLADERLYQHKAISNPTTRG